MIKARERVLLKLEASRVNYENRHYAWRGEKEQPGRLLVTGVITSSPAKIVTFFSYVTETIFLTMHQPRKSTQLYTNYRNLTKPCLQLKFSNCKFTNFPKLLTLVRSKAKLIRKRTPKLNQIGSDRFPNNEVRTR